MKSMQIKKEQIPIIITHVVGLVFFSQYFIETETERFLIYCGVITIGILTLIFTNSKINYHINTLWGLTILFFMHVAGSGIPINGDRLYDYIVLPISEIWPIIRYDNLVHILGSFVATFIVFHFLQPLLKKGSLQWPKLVMLLILGGLGVGSIIENLEFIAKYVFNEDGIGGYLNTSLDLVANLVGASLATIVIWVKKS